MESVEPSARPELRAPEGDPRRQATGAVRGFDYQIWQSVDLWTALGPDEALFLEAAEDADRTTAGAVEAGQVKALARPLTLRSAPVRDALRHYWDLRASNPSLRVSFALITTAPRGIETDRPFGEVRGLDEWDRCRSDLADPGPLRAFLAALGLGPGLAAFLQTATDDDLRHALLRPLRWVTGEPDRAGIRDRVERRVILHGDRLGLSPAQSRPATDALYVRAWDVVTSDPPRRLDRVSFLEAFEEATAVLTPRSVLATTGALAARTGRVLSTDVGALVRSPVSRPSLVRDVRERLAHLGALALTGSSGMGKSTLAALVAAAGGGWVRLDLRGRGEGDAADHLALAALAVDGLPPATSVVVDDLPPSETGRIDRPLVDLVRAAVERGGRVLVTAHGPLPDAVLSALGQGEGASHVDTPPLSESELRELCRSHGCPEDRAGRWGRVIEIQTGGHPQLAAAHARSAAERGWGPVSDDDLFGSPPPLEKVKREARRRLVASLAGLGAVDLAYRLSLYATPFTRSQALRFAAAEPAIPGAGDALDVLTGPWLERVNDAHLRVSPLLSKSYESQFDPQTVKRLHHAAALSFLGPVLDPRAFNGLLLHGITGECGEALVAAARSVDDLDEDAFGRLAEWVSWLAYAATDEFRPLYRPDPLVSALLRSLQLRVALALGKEDVAVGVVRAALRELDEAGTVGVPPTTEVLRFQFASQVVAHIEGSAHVPFVIEQAVVAARTSAAGLLGELEEIATRHGLTPPPLDEGLGIASLNDLVQPLMALLSVRIRSADALGRLLDTVEREPDLELALAPLFQDDTPSATAMTDGAWLEEYRAEKAGDRVDWTLNVDLLRRTVAFADARGYPALGTSARRSLATVLREHVRDKQAALAVLAGSPARRVELDEYRAKMHLLDDEPAAALDLYRRVLPAWGTGPGLANTTRAYAYHDAVRAAGLLGRFDEAAELAGRGAAVAAEELANVPSPLPIGYLADQAYALYLAGRRAEGVQGFERVLAELDAAPPRGGFGVVRGRVGHTLVLIEQEVAGRPPPEGYGDAFVGLFSKPEPDHVDYDAPALPVIVWGRLAHIEALVSASRVVSERFVALSDGDANPLVAHDRAQHLAAAAIRSADPGLLAAINESYRCAALGAGVDPDKVRPFHMDLAHSAFGLASIQAAADRRLAALPAGEWAQAAAALLGEAADALRGVERWHDTARLAADLERGSRRAAPLLRQRMVETSEVVSVRATAAAALAAHAEDPDTRFYANATILQFAESRAFSEHLASAVALLVTGDPLAGYAGAARAVLAAQPRVTISTDGRSYFERVASGASAAG